MKYKKGKQIEECLRKLEMLTAGPMQFINRVENLDIIYDVIHHVIIELNSILSEE